MKRPLFIIIGAIIILILLGVWIYILVFSDTTNPDTYTDVTLGDTTDYNYNQDQMSDQEPVVDVEGPERLRQLTTTPVVGYQEIHTLASSSPMVYYVAAGTGHIFSINLETGEEKRVSATTIPSSYKAVITPDGSHTLIQSGSGAGADFVIGTLSTTSEQMETTLLGEAVIDFTTTIDNTFLYAIKTGSSVIAKEYDPAEADTKTLFTVPFREAVISWGHTADAIHYVYPKATNKLEGYLYAVTDGTLVRLPISGYGLSAVGTEAGVVYSKQEQGNYNNYLYNQNTTKSTATGLTIIPEKCVGLKTDSVKMLCSGISEVLQEKQHLPDIWYQGRVTIADNLWLLDPQSGIIEQSLAVFDEVGRTLEITNLTPNETDQRYYFTNATTQNLWVFNYES